MPSWPIRLAAIPVLILSFAQLTAEPAEPNGQHGILFITSVDPDQAEIATLIDATRSRIQDGSDRPVHFDVEYLDPYLFARDGENEKKIVAFLAAKYAHQRFEVIIAIGTRPLQFAEKFGPQLFPRASIVSARMVSLAAEQDPGAHPGRTDVRVVMNVVPTINVALDQNPGTRHVALVAGSSREDQRTLQEAKEQFSSYFPGINILDFSNNSVDEIKRKLSGLDTDTIVLFLDLTADGTGEEYISARVLPEIARAANRPMYGIFSEQVGKGVVGGSVIDMHEVGGAVGKTALRVLQGERPESIPYTISQFQHYVFDAREVSRWGIVTLPGGSAVLYHEDTPWNEYKWQIIGLVAAIFLEGALIALLLKISIQRRRAERELARMRAVESLESGLASTLLHLPPHMLNAAIDRGFKQFIDFFGIDCVSLFEFLEDKARFRLLHHRCLQGSPLRMSRLKPEEFRWTTEQLLHGQPVVVRTRAEVQREAPSVMAAISQAGLHSFAGVPLKASGKVFGAIFFSSSKDRDWDARLLAELQTIANIMGAGLERARTQASLTQSEQLKTSILASLPSLVAVLDMEGNITSVNSTAVAYGDSGGFGCAGLKPGLNYFDICKTAAQHGSRYAELALQGLQQVCSNANSQFEMEYPSGAESVRWFHMTVVPLLGKQGGVVVSHTDVTQRKLAELDLKESEGRFRLMADSAPVLMWMSGTDRVCTHFNKSWLEFTGKGLEDEIGEGWLSGIHPDDLESWNEICTRAFEGRQRFTTEFRLRRFDGQYRWVMSRGVPRFRSDGTFSGYIGCADDITDQKEAEAARAEISGRLIRAQEEERARIARELHDDINQKLGLLAIDIQQLHQRLPELDERAHQDLSALFEKTNRISGDVQRLSHQLHSSRLDYLGLPAALRRLCEEFTEQHGILTECVITVAPVDIGREINLCLFRVAQECLSNTAKHSAAKHARVELHCDGATVCMNISDDGAGFNIEQVGSRHEPGLGLISMRERLRLVNGEFSVRSEPGVATTISAVVALNPGALQDRPYKPLGRAG
jgi:PAS domain S-box-containing protein